MINLVFLNTLSSVGRSKLRKKYTGIRTVMPMALSFTTPCESILKERTKFEKKIPSFIEEFHDDDTIIEKNETPKEQHDNELIQEEEQNQEDIFTEDEKRS